jgi:hypothetical protein
LNELVASKLILQGCLTTTFLGTAPWSGNCTAHISFEDVLLINPTYFDIVFHIVQMQGTPVQACQSQVTLIRMISWLIQ